MEVKEAAVKLDNGKRKLSLIHPSTMAILLPRDGPAGIISAMLNLSEAAHAKDEAEFLMELHDAIRDIVNYLCSSVMAIEQLSTAMEYGERKPEYGRNNWKKGMEWSRYIDAALRHGLAVLGGDITDKDSKNTHVAHMLGSIHMLLGNHSLRVGVNDLY